MPLLSTKASVPLSLRASASSLTAQSCSTEREAWGYLNARSRSRQNCSIWLPPPKVISASSRQVGGHGCPSETVQLTWPRSSIEQTMSSWPSSEPYVRSPFQSRAMSCQYWVSPRPHSCTMAAARALADRLRGRAQLLGDGTDRFPLRPKRWRRLSNHPNRTFTQLDRIPPRPSLLCHSSILSEVRACAIPGSTRTGWRASWLMDVFDPLGNLTSAPVPVLEVLHEDRCPVAGFE